MNTRIAKFYCIASLLPLLLLCGTASAQTPVAKVALKTASGHYLCAEGSGSREVVANRNAIGPWESFIKSDLGGNKMALRAANGQYVCAEGGGGSTVVANRNAVGPWETFTLVPLAEGSSSGNAPAAVAGQWTKLNGIDGAISALLIANNGTPIAAANGSVPGTTGGVFAFDGQTFNRVANLTGLTNLAVRSIAVIQSLTFAGTSAGPGGGIFQCCNNQQWTPASNGLVRPNVSPSSNPPSVLAFAATSGFVLAGTNLGGVFRSQDGSNWGNNTLLNRTIFSFFVSGSGSFMLAGTDQGFFRSTDNGANWGTGSLSGHSVLAFAANGNTLFAGTSGGLFRSTDSGMSWALFDNLPSPRQPVMALLLVSNNTGNQIFAGTGTGVFRSTDNGQTWQACTGLPNPVATSLAASGNLLFVGTSGGVFKGTGFINT
jgi:hypothetical protein